MLEVDRVFSNRESEGSVGNNCRISPFDFVTHLMILLRLYGNFNKLMMRPLEFNLPSIFEYEISAIYWDNF